MMNSWIVIALLAGLASALIFAAAGIPTLTAAAVFLLAPAPLMIAGLGWGLVVTLLGGAAGAVVLSLMIGWAFAVPYLLSTAVPAAIVCRLALQQRPAAPVDGGEGEVRSGDVEWYPEGRVLIAIALMAAALASGLVIMAGPDAASFRASTDQLLDRVLAIQEIAPTSAEQKQRLESVRALFASILPAAAAMGWTLSTFANFRLAETIAARLRITARPLPRFGTLAFPRIAAVGLMVASASALLPDSFGLIGGAFAGGLSAAFAVLGLAVLHGLLEGHPFRAMLLVALYVAVVVLGFALALPLIVTAILDMVFRMRARTRSSQSGGSV
jgi:Predicted membrane protein (DUF2232)